MLRLNKKGQSAVEYAVLIIIAIGVFLAITNYFKRGIQGRWKEVVDDMGDQYDPRLANGIVRQTFESNIDTQIQAFNAQGGFWTRRADQTRSIERKTGFITVGDAVN